MFSSANARLLNLTEEFCEALINRDTPRLKYTTTRMVLLVGEIIVLRLTVCLVKKAVSLPFFSLDHWLTVCDVSGHF